MGKKVLLSGSDGHSINAYRADPDTTAKGLIVVLQEIFGVNSHIRGVCDRFASAGYATLAPALFDRIERDFEVGYEADDVSKGRALKEKAKYDDALIDVQAAINLLSHEGKVGIVGYCWGGSVAWLSASRLENITAAVCYYGGDIPKFNNEKPRCSTMLHFGEVDKSIPIEKVIEIQNNHSDLITHVYPGAAHGFNCEQRGSYDETSSKLALGRSLKFFEDNLV